MDAKRLSTLSLVFLTILLTVGLYLVYQKHLPQEKTAKTGNISPPMVSTKQPNLNPQPKQSDLLSANWQIYRDLQYRFELQYPKTITLLTSEPKLLLFHAIPFEHPDPCDLKSDNPLPLKEFTDFKVSIELTNLTLKEAVLATSGNFLAEYLNDNKLSIVSGFIDPADFSALKGYRVTSGNEGCGIYAYYFPLDAQTTLVVLRYFIAEFQAPIDNQVYYKLPKVIKPDAEELIFEQIMNSFKYIKN